MKALVTGAAGFIGAYVVRALASRGVEVVESDRPGAAWPSAPGSGPSGMRVEVDLDSHAGSASLGHDHRPDVLIHLAWHASPRDYLSSPENLRSLDATNRLVAHVLDSGCRRVVGIGTCLEYAASDHPSRESEASGPDTLYSSSKHAARMAGERLALDRGASFAWARVFHLHGPHEDARRLVPMVAARLRRGEPIDLSPGGQVRDYLRVEDVADAIAAVAVSDAMGTVNVCSGAPITLRDFLLAVGDVLGRPDLLRFGAIPYRDGERLFIAGVPGVLGRLGWAPRYRTPAAALQYLAT